MNKLFISIIRFLFDLVGSLIGPTDCNVEIKDVLIDNNVKLTIYTPLLLQGKKNIALYYHGGGWIVGSIKAYNNILKYICSKSGFIVIGIEYRKAPEFKYPKALDDASAAYLWVIKNIVKDDNDAKIALIGDSAGGGLVLSLINIIKEQHYAPPSLAVLIYPAIGITHQTLNDLKNTKPKWLNLFGYFAIKYCLRQYLKNMNEIELLSNNQLSAGAFDANFLPKILILLAEWDPLSKLIIKWQESQVNHMQDITCITYSSTIHGFFNFTRISKQAQRALDKIVDSLLTQI